LLLTEVTEATEDLFLRDLCDLCERPQFSGG